MPHYNTTGEQGELLLQFRAQAENQDSVVLAYFESAPGRLLSPSQVQAAAVPLAPLTSVRRSITDLTKRGRLRKTDRKVIGPYGRPETCWTLNRAERQS